MMHEQAPIPTHFDKAIRFINRSYDIIEHGFATMAQNLFKHPMQPMNEDGFIYKRLAFVNSGLAEKTKKIMDAHVAPWLNENIHPWMHKHVHPLAKKAGDFIEEKSTDGRRGYRDKDITDFRKNGKNTSLSSLKLRSYGQSVRGAASAIVGLPVAIGGFIIGPITPPITGFAVSGLGFATLSYGVSRVRKAERGREQIKAFEQNLTELHQDPELSKLLDELTRANKILSEESYKNFGRKFVEGAKMLLAEYGLEFKPLYVKLGDDLDTVRAQITSPEALNTIKAARLVATAQRHFVKNCPSKRISQEQAKEIIARVDDEYVNLTGQTSSTTRFEENYNTGTVENATPSLTTLPAERMGLYA